MTPLLLLALGAAMQDPAAAMRHYEAGDYVAAAEAFRAASAERPEAAELLYDLALAEWRAGRLLAAEEAAERYAAAPGGGRVDLHRGLLGNIRYGEAEALAAQASAPPTAAATPLAPVAPGTPPGAPPPSAPAPVDPVAVLEQAVQKAKAARDEFVRAATAPTAGPELLRNTERALRLIADLEQQLEAAKKQREQEQEQQQQDGDKNEDQQDGKQDGDPKDQQDQQQQDQKSQQDQQQQDQQGQQGEGDPKPPDAEPPPQDGEERPEPKPEPDPQAGKPEPEPEAKTPEPSSDAEAKEQQGAAEPRPEPRAGEDQPATADQPRTDAPGEQAAGTELSPEQRQRLLEELQKLDQRLRALRAAAGARKAPVERDW